MSTQVVGGRGEVLTAVMGQVVCFEEEAIGKDQKVTAHLQAEITGEWKRTCLLRNSQDGLGQGWAPPTPLPGLASARLLPPPLAPPPDPLVLFPFSRRQSFQETKQGEQLIVSSLCSKAGHVHNLKCTVSLGCRIKQKYQ